MLESPVSSNSPDKICDFNSVDEYNPSETQNDNIMNELLNQSLPSVKEQKKQSQTEREMKVKHLKTQIKQGDLA